MVTVQERRRYYRHPLQVPIRVSRQVQAHTHYHSQDVSEGGLSFECPEHLSPGDEIEVSIPVKNQLFHLAASVSYSRRDDKTGLFKTGVSFHDAESLFRAKIAEELLAMTDFRKDLSAKLGHEISEEEAAIKWVEKRAKQFAEAFKTRKN